MKLITNWLDVLKKSWSLKLIYLGMLLIALETLMSIIGIEWLPFDGWLQRLIAFIILAAATYCRIVLQPNLSVVVEDSDVTTEQ